MKDTAFIQAGAWERIYGALARALGVSVSGGDKSTLPDDGTAISFETKLPRQTDVAFAGYSVLGTDTDGKVEIVVK